MGIFTVREQRAMETVWSYGKGSNSRVEGVT